MEVPDLPLKAVRVADFTQLVQGPFATQIMGDLGADVIKIEPPGGDWSRRWSLANAFPGGESLSFLAFNRNKRSIVLDLKTSDGLAAAERLVATCDVLVENFRPGVMDRLGLGYEAVRALSPGIVYCSSSGYGSRGPYRDRPGQDLLIQALTGLVKLSGRADDPPTPVGIGISDLAAGFHIVYAILAALARRDGSGSRGCRVEVDLLSSTLALLQQELTAFLATGAEPLRSAAGIAHPYAGAPLGLYRTRDGHVAIAMGAVGSLASLLKVEELLDNDSSNAIDGRDQIKRRLEDATTTHTTAELVNRLLASGVWCAPVQDFDEVTSDRHIVENGLIVEIDHRRAGPFRTIAAPIRLDGERPPVRLPPPLLGEHSRDILVELGYAGLELERLLGEVVLERNEP
jgi:crotonobetainyl-CoA:carnitine CoA-transferase CaiB-like acyl-CoA transferase